MTKLPTLRIGNKGPSVELLQLALQRSGNDPGAADGVFGSRTAAALQAFQRQNALPADGIAGQRTWLTLEPYLLGYVTRVIRPGDTLYRLASAYGTTVVAIQSANPAIDPFNLQPGSRLVIPYAFPLLPAEIRFTSVLLDYTLRGLKARYPFLSLTSAGRSVLGKPLWCIRCGNGDARMFINAAHHANEWITTPVVLTWLEEYCNAVIRGTDFYGTDAAALFAETAVFLMPMVDPDGVDLVTGGITSGPAYEKAAAIAAGFPDISFPDGWKANIEGTDLNLQYPAGWEEARRIKFAQGFTRPAPRDFVGTAPLSAPESKAVYDLTLANDFLLTLSYHTQGQVIFWRYGTEDPKNARAIGEALSRASGYALENTPPESANAGYKDWFILRYDRPGYTVEAGLGENPLPPAQLPDLLQENLPLMTEALRLTAELG